MCIRDSASTGAFEIPDRITSLTIDSDTDGTVRVLKISGDGALSNIYANGKKLYVGKDIQISGSDIYGGGYEKDITLSLIHILQMMAITHITINGTSMLLTGNPNEADFSSFIPCVSGRISAIF